jgi:hypothetical protein
MRRKEGRRQKERMLVSVGFRKWNNHSALSVKGMTKRRRFLNSTEGTFLGYKRIIF